MRRAICLRFLLLTSYFSLSAMLIFDQLKKNDPQLHLLSLLVIAGVMVLLAGLWWVQIVSANDYRQNLETQSYRTVRIPAVRGKILDRSGIVLAENQPRYVMSLYLEDLADGFKKEFDRLRPQRTITNSLPFWKRWLGSPQVRTTSARLTPAQRRSLEIQARYNVASRVVEDVGQRLQERLSLDPANFERHYATRLALPYPVANDIKPSQIARFEEQSASPLGLDLEVQSARSYPYGSTAAHVLGYLQFDDRSITGEEAFFSYRLPDYRGAIGIEFGFDADLHGRAGEKSVLVNNFGYRHAEDIWTPVEPGRNVVLTIDLQIQQAAERALQSAAVAGTPRGAAVVMDVRTGDVLALVSAPAFDPNLFVPKPSPEEYQRLQDPKLRPEINRATQENYAPGSIFKPVVGLACLEAGLDPRATIYNPGYIYVGRRRVHDLAAPGTYDFRRAIMFSSNTYFITNGTRAGIENIVKLGQKLHLGESVKLPTHQETKGIFPSLEKIHSGWSEGDTANLCIGQGYIDVTPLQMAVMTSALANGGKVLWPRLVDRIESADQAADEPVRIFPKGQIRDYLGVNPRNLRIVQDAMRDEVEDEGTGSRAVVPGLRICGKTGTAQVMNERNQEVDRTTWFISFAPYEAPRWAVVVMVESGNFGGTTCAPLAAKIYAAILQAERTKSPRTGSMARLN
jgi:penicillin-binding protein 2